MAAHALPTRRPSTITTTPSGRRPTDIRRYPTSPAPSITGITRANCRQMRYQPARSASTVKKPNGSMCTHPLANRLVPARRKSIFRAFCYPPGTPMATRSSFLRDLGDGLTLRTATAADAEPLATFVGDTLRAQDGDAPDHHLADWTRDLLEGHHPSFTPADATVVTDAQTGEIVSCLHLLSQTWSYGGVPISVGQPELIGTRTARRGHGLVRAQFEVHHRWAAERGHQALAIAGIPWFYRQFGYEFAIERGGGPLLHADGLLDLLAVPPGWRVRAARLDDVAFLVTA